MKTRMHIDTPALSILVVMMVLMGGLYASTQRTARLAGAAHAREETKPEPVPEPVTPPPAPPPQMTVNPPPECVRIGVMEFVKKQGPGVAEIACQGKRWRCIVTVVNEQANYNCGLLAVDTPASGPQGGFSL